MRLIMPLDAASGKEDVLEARPSLSNPYSTVQEMAAAWE